MLLILKLKMCSTISKNRFKLKLEFPVNRLQTARAFDFQLRRADPFNVRLRDMLGQFPLEVDGIFQFRVNAFQINFFG